MHGFSAGPSTKIDRAGVTVSLLAQLAPLRSPARPDAAIFAGKARKQGAAVAGGRSAQTDE